MNPKYKPRLHIVLHQPEIPPNTGNAGRTCVAVGAKLWLVKPLGFSMSQKRLRRAGLDYWRHLEWESVSCWDELAEKLTGGRFWFFSKSAERLYTDVSYNEGDVLVFGSETRGLPQKLLDDNSAAALRIPIREEVRSLNLASAVAAATFEAVRQLDAGGPPL